MGASANVTEWLAWAITGQKRFHDAYELAWRYTINKPVDRWTKPEFEVVEVTMEVTAYVARR